MKKNYTIIRQNFQWKRTIFGWFPAGHAAAQRSPPRPRLGRRLRRHAGVRQARLLGGRRRRHAAVRALRDRRAGPVGRGRRARRAAAGRPRARSARALALGAVGYAMQAGLYFLALERMDASVLSLILYSYPALVTGAAILLRRESASRRRLVALVTASGGLVLVLAGAGVGSLDLAGCALGAGAALTYTTYILVSDGVTAQLRPAAAGRAGEHGRGRQPRRSSPRRPATWTSGSRPRAGSGSGLAALVSTVGAVVLFFSGLSRVGPSTAAILSTLEPPVTVALVFLTFGEALGARPAARRARRARRGRDREPTGARRRLAMHHRPHAWEAPSRCAALVLRVHGRSGGRGRLRAAVSDPSMVGASRRDRAPDVRYINPSDNRWRRGRPWVTRSEAYCEDQPFRFRIDA